MSDLSSEDRCCLDLAIKFADWRNAHSRTDLHAADRSDTNGWSKHWIAGAAHRLCAKKDALPILSLVIKKQPARIVAEPQVVAEHYAAERKGGWDCEDTAGFASELLRIRESRRAHVCDARD